jgi:hypothetical protein
MFELTNDLSLLDLNVSKFHLIETIRFYLEWDEHPPKISVASEVEISHLGV